MAFNTGKFMRTLFVVVLAGILVLAGVDRFTNFGKSDAVADPADLVRQAREALDAVRRRQPGDRRPASYDAVLAPLDRLLAQARNLVRDVGYDPIADYQKVFDITDPVINIAGEAHQQALTETGPLAKEFRFNQQKGEASQYLASAMYSRMTARLERSTLPGEQSPRLPEADVAAITRVLNTGLEADSDNPTLYYMRGIIQRDNGIFAAAARDIEKSLEIDSENADAWNVLGLIRINLKEFDKAEEALEKARSLILSQAEANKSNPGEEYTTTIYNLARFHEGLAAFYARENRMSPSAENQRLANRHGGEARKYFREFLDREPPDSPDAKLARRLLDGLPE